MGKQINFYMSDKIQASFIEYLEQNQFMFLDYNAQIVEQPFSANVYSMYLYKKNYGEVIMRQDIRHIMDTLNGPVMEFSKTIIKQEEKKVLQGRIWISDDYFNENGVLIKKDIAFIKDYQMLNRWIKKHVPYQEIKKGEYLIKAYVNDELIKLQEKGFRLTM
ncbi:MAG: hypothetical protein IKL22_10890 [Lachnospiraceae bacterium]|nr:hypothetical protein [Lachnospiraceae bacterium]